MEETTITNSNTANVFLKVRQEVGTGTLNTFEEVLNSEDTVKENGEQQLQLILNCIIPPRVYESHGRLVREEASLHPATRLDMIVLEEKLDEKLKERGAKPFGICPIRRDLYDQFFDEIIRQVGVACGERGLLLSRVRDEIRMSFSAYQSVLESAISFGVKKSLQIENEQTKATTDWKVQKEKNAELQFKISQLEKKIANDKIVNEEELEILEQRMRDTNERVVEANRILKNQLQSILQMDEMSRLNVATSTVMPDMK